MPSELRIAHSEAGTAEPSTDPAPIGGNPGPELPPALLMTVDDLARELRTSAKTIRRMDQSGRLPRAVKISHGKRWPRQTIVRWIAASCPPRTEWERFHA
jgi:predicted DNA-binding transcriptional regulator AlpA